LDKPYQFERIVRPL